MAKFQSPLLGYNNNVRHRGRLFHIQTEDSGVNHPHVITHLFMDGGRILKSVKKSYAEHVGNDGMSNTVKLLMKEQHKAMFVALRDGEFDSLVDVGKKPSPTGTPRVTKANGDPESDPSLLAAASSERLLPAAPPTDKELPPSSEPGPVPEPMPEEEMAPMGVVPVALVVAGRDADQEPSTDPEPSTSIDAAEVEAEESAPNTVAEKRRPSAQELTLDFDALDRDTAEVSPQYQPNHLPPPPKNMFTKERGTGAYSTVEVEAHHQDARPATPHPGTTGPASTRKTPSGRSPPAEGRYAASRPPTFGQTPKAPTTSSIFNDELVSDKSLDEVILSYLAEDLDPPSRK